MAQRALEILAEHSDEPQTQLKELLEIMLNSSDFQDFGQSEWCSLFELMAQKIEQVSQLHQQVDEERQSWQHEYNLAQSKLQNISNADQ